MRALPLLGKRVLVTRAKAQSSKLQQQLEAAGAEVVAIPAIEIAPPDSYDGLDHALRSIVSQDWLVLTSANAVHAIAGRARHIGVPIEALSSVFIATIGSATADAVTALGLAVELIPPRAVAESLAEALSPHVSGKNVLLCRANIARDVLPDSLRKSGAIVTIVDAYQTVIPLQSVDALRAAFRGGIDAVTFTSASSVHNLAALAERAGVSVPAGTKRISIGPITTNALEELGWQADATSDRADVDSLVNAVIQAMARLQELQ